jgi:putative lysine transport system permease protein
MVSKGMALPRSKDFCHGYSILIRGTPMMVQAMIFKYGCQALGVNWNSIAQGVEVFDGWFYAGIIVITFNTAAYMAEIVNSGLNGIDKGQIEGAASLGLSPFQTLMKVSLPQAIRNSIPTIGNEWIVNIKDSSVLNVIGVSELYFMSGPSRE